MSVEDVKEEFLDAIRGDVDCLASAVKEAYQEDMWQWAESEFEKTEITIAPNLDGSLDFELWCPEIAGEKIPTIKWADVECGLLSQFRPGEMGDEETQWREAIRKRGEALIAAGNEYLKAAEQNKNET